jgi:hypothetical protein
LRRHRAFLGRQSELALLEEKYASPRSEVVEKSLISLHGPTAALGDSQYFHHFVTLDDIL